MHHTNTLFCSHHRFIRIFLCLRVECDRLERTTLSPNSIAKEIFSRLEEIEQQQGGNWTLEEIKRALMDDMRAMIQDELRQALTGLIPPPPATAIPIAPTIPSTTDAPPTATAIPPAVIVLPTAKGKPSNGIKVVPMKKKNVRSAGRKNCQTGGTHHENTSRVAKVHKV